jgi:hypothetical protein
MIYIFFFPIFQRELGLTLPAWTNAIFPDPLSKITAQSFVINAMTPVLQRLKGGKSRIFFLIYWK